MTPEANRSLTRKFHSALWWVMVFIFALLSLKQFLSDGLRDELPLYGVLFIITATLARAIVMAVDFSKAGEKRNSWLSLLLIILIGLAALVGRLT